MSLNNVPQTGQTLVFTRDLIAQNFSVIDTAFTVAAGQPQHISYNDGSGNQGMHNFIQMPIYAGATNPPIVNSAANQIGLYNKIGVFAGDIFIKKNVPNVAAGTVSQQEYAMTFFKSVNTAPVGNSGWTVLPSGLILLWGRENTSNGPQLYTNFAVFPGFVQFASAPFFTTNSNVFVYASAYSSTGFTPVASSGNAIYSFFVIGI